jgi:Rrf2 family protein
LHGTLRISDAAAMALHAMTLMAADPGGRHAVREIAGTLRVSEAHLAKVLQRLMRMGLVSSTRGPGGGYVLARPRDEITLLDIVEAIEGPLDPADCIMPTRTCTGGVCILGDLLETINRRVREYLGGTNLDELAGIYA